MKSIRVLIVEERQQVREGLATLLKLSSARDFPAIDVSGEAKNGSEALQLARVERPDVVLVDLEMTGEDACQAARRIKSEQPSARVIALTIQDGPLAQQRALKAGADALFTKGNDLGDLLKAIHAEYEKIKAMELRKGEKNE